jgi:hypothetical protein
MSGPSNIKKQKTGAEEIGNGHGLCPLLILSVLRHRGVEVLVAWDLPEHERFE